MSEPVSLLSATARLGLPFLFTAQAQKETFLNEALARLDGAVHAVIESEASAPPADPADGQCWLIGADATGSWLGQQPGTLACRQAGLWLFTPPFDGLRLYDRALGQERFFLGGWRLAARPGLPAGGTTIDSEARQAIAELITALEQAGILSGA